MIPVEIKIYSKIWTDPLVFINVLADTLCSTLNIKFHFMVLLTYWVNRSSYSIYDWWVEYFEQYIHNNDQYQILILNVFFFFLK